MITDRGSNFLSKEVEEFLSVRRIKHLRTSPYHPATNGLIERMHGMLNHGISTMCSSRVDLWDEYITEVVWGLRVRTHSVTKHSPFYLLFSVHPRLSGDFAPPGRFLTPLDEAERRIAVEDYTDRELEGLEVARGEAYLRTQAQKEKDFYFKLDDWVKIKNHQKLKFQYSWKGPYIVHGFGYFPTYWLSYPNGKFVKSLLNQSNMAPWTARLEETEDFFYGFEENESSDSPEQDLDALEEEFADSAFLGGGNDVAVLNSSGLGQGGSSSFIGSQGYLSPT